MQLKNGFISTMHRCPQVVALQRRQEGAGAEKREREAEMIRMEAVLRSTGEHAASLERSLQAKAQELLDLQTRLVDTMQSSRSQEDFDHGKSASEALLAAVKERSVQVQTQLQERTAELQTQLQEQQRVSQGLAEARCVGCTYVCARRIITSILFY